MRMVLECRLRSRMSFPESASQTFRVAVATSYGLGITGTLTLDQIRDLPSTGVSDTAQAGTVGRTITVGSGKFASTGIDPD